MDTANPLANQSTIALVLLHQYADSDTYRTLDPGRQALVQEAIECLTAFEETGPACSSPSVEDPAGERAPPETTGLDARSGTRADRRGLDASPTRGVRRPIGTDDEPNRAANADDLITDFRVS